MSTYEALRFFGLDYYATASDIKAAYRRRESALRTVPAVGTAKLVREAEERMDVLKRAYAALHHRVDHTPPDIDPLSGVEAGAKSKTLTATLRVPWNRNLAAEWWRQLGLPRGLPRGFSLEIPRMQALLPRVGRLAAAMVVLAGVGYGIVRGSAAKYPVLSVVDAKTVNGPQVKPTLPVRTAQVTAVQKAPSALEKKSPVATSEARPWRPPVLRGVDAEEAKAIGAACLAETGSRPGAFQACVVRTARETPHAIHLD